MTDSQETAHFLDYWRIIRSRKEIVIAVFVMVVVTGAGVTFYQPKVYMASAKIQVMKEMPDVRPFSNEQLLRYDPWFLRTQFEIIQSAPIMEDVIRRHNLVEKFGRAYGYLDKEEINTFEQTVKILSKSMKVTQYRDTNLIEVRMYLSEPKETVRQDAAVVANAIVECYRDQQMKRSRETKEAAMTALYEALEEQKLAVADAEKKLAEIRTNKGIAILYGKGTEITLGGSYLAAMNDLRLRVKLELEDKRTRYEKVKDLSGDELLETAYRLAADTALGALVSDKRRAEIELRGMMESLGEKHPDVVRVKQKINEVDAKISDALKGLIKAMQTDFEAAEAKYKTLESEQEAQKKSEINLEAGDYLEFERAREKLEHARVVRDNLESSYMREKIELQIPRTIVEIIERAKAPEKSDFVSPRLMLNLILSILVGCFAGLGLAYFLEYLDTSIKTMDELERLMGTSVIGVMPQKIRPLNDRRANPAHGEAYRLLRTNIRFSKKFEHGKTICVTSGSVGEGKSLTVFNLAYTCAQLGERVLLIDADLHRPKQHKFLKVANERGIANILIGESSLEETVLATQVANLDFIPSGRIAGQVHGILNNALLKDIVRELKENYDIILFDAPPAIGVSDASLLMREMDGVVLIIQHRKYPKEISMRAKEMVGNLGGNLIGIVLNNINISKDYSAYYYQQHYDYYPQK